MDSIDKKIEKLLDAQSSASDDLKEAHEKFIELKQRGLIRNSSYDVPLMNRLTVKNRRKKSEHKLAALLDA